MDIFAVFTFLLISRHSEVVSNFGFLRWNREPNTLLLITHMTHDFRKKISPLLVAGPSKSQIWDTIAKNPDLIERKGHSFGHMWPKNCQNQLRYLRQHFVCYPVLSFNLYVKALKVVNDCFFMGVRFVHITITILQLCANSNFKAFRVMDL